MEEEKTAHSSDRKIKTRKRTIGEKLGMSLGLIVMWPMMYDAPNAKDDIEKQGGFWAMIRKVLKEIWTGEEMIYEEEG